MISTLSVMQMSKRQNQQQQLLLKLWVQQPQIDELSKRKQTDQTLHLALVLAIRDSSSKIISQRHQFQQTYGFIYMEIGINTNKFHNSTSYFRLSQIFSHKEMSLPKVQQNQINKILKNQWGVEIKMSQLQTTARFEVFRIFEGLDWKKLCLAQKLKRLNGERQKYARSWFSSSARCPCFIGFAEFVRAILKGFRKSEPHRNVGSVEISGKVKEKMRWERLI